MRVFASTSGACTCPQSPSQSHSPQQPIAPRSWPTSEAPTDRYGVSGPDNTPELAQHDEEEGRVDHVRHAARPGCAREDMREEKRADLPRLCKDSGLWMCGVTAQRTPLLAPLMSGTSPHSQHIHASVTDRSTSPHLHPPTRHVRPPAESPTWCLRAWPSRGCKRAPTAPW